jgi:hypothetical protein
MQCLSFVARCLCRLSAGLLRHRKVEHIVEMSLQIVIFKYNLPFGTFKYSWVLTMEHSSCHSCGAQIFYVASRFLVFLDPWLKYVIST